MNTPAPCPATPPRPRQFARRIAHWRCSVPLTLLVLTAALALAGPRISTARGQGAPMARAAGHVYFVTLGRPAAPAPAGTRVALIAWRSPLDTTVCGVTETLDDEGTYFLDIDGREDCAAAADPNQCVWWVFVVHNQNAGVAGCPTRYPTDPVNYVRDLDLSAAYIPRYARDDPTAALQVGDRGAYVLPYRVFHGRLGRFNLGARKEYAVLPNEAAADLALAATPLAQTTTPLIAGTRVDVLVQSEGCFNRGVLSGCPPDEPWYTCGSGTVDDDQGSIAIATYPVPECAARPDRPAIQFALRIEEDELVLLGCDTDDLDDPITLGLPLPLPGVLQPRRPGTDRNPPPIVYVPPPPTFPAYPERTPLQGGVSATAGPGRPTQTPRQGQVTAIRTAPVRTTPAGRTPPPATTPPPTTTRTPGTTATPTATPTPTRPPRVCAVTTEAAKLAQSVDCLQITSVEFAAVPVVQDCVTEAPPPWLLPAPPATQNCQTQRQEHLVSIFNEQTLTTSALPVYWQIQRIHEFTAGGDAFSVSCDSSPAAWMDCDPIPDGTAEKIWPVLVTQGTYLGIVEARFALEPGFAPANAILEATATLSAPCGGARVLHFHPKPVTIPSAGGELVVNNLATDEPLPACVAFLNPVAITWRLRVGDILLPAGQSRHPIYLTYRNPVTPEGVDAEYMPYLSLVDLTVNAAAGLTPGNEAAVAAAIWREFSDRDVRRRDLNPIDGSVTIGAQLHYYTPFSLAAFLSGYTLSRDCPANWVVELLSTTLGRCGAWGRFLASAFGVQGLYAAAVGISEEPDWHRLQYFPADAQYMLVGGAAQWTFVGSGSSGNPDYPYLVRALVSLGHFSWIVPPEFDSVAGAPGSLLAQGTNAPWNIFSIGDHEVVNYPADGARRIYDPSYGTGPFDSTDQWAAASVAGSATTNPIGLATAPDVPCALTATPTPCLFYARQGLFLPLPPGP